MGGRAEPHHDRLVEAPLQKLLDAQAEPRVDPMGSDLHQGNQNESPLVKPGVWQDEMRPLYRGVTGHEKVQVDGAGSVTPLSAPSLPSFDILTNGEQDRWFERALHPSHRIREPRLRGSFHRLGPVETRHAFYGNGALPQPSQRQGDLRHRLAEVRAQADEPFL